MGKESYFTYVEGGRKISFISNLKDGPHAYDIVFGQSHIYVPDRIIEEITGPGASKQRFEDALSSLTGNTLDATLAAEGLTIDELERACLKLRIKEGEDEKLAAYAQQREQA